ncbi:3-oxoacyl-ACP reductase [Planotetraspora silvatica]|uniref:3-oxoacyl-ACP reductase n=1 Tax=Planotetraspora silvatica TaxID=234614 RepID=A0A8J3UPD2_9ACTN|nr:SDR family oxidoreductase [Planotetraspora silvatica]GII47011.1 3-oxoacyl-ACP reductase [Planotetraspora silvatica]
MTITHNAAEADELRYATYPSLRDRVAFVSGGSTGLGSEFVSALAAQGVRVGFADIDVAGAERLLERLSRTDCPEPLFVEADVRDVGQVQAAVAEVGDRLGPISILVNNAANDERHDSAVVDEAYWDNAIAVNLKHHFFAIQAVVPGMRALGGGSVINLGSISAHADFVGLPAYVTSKAGIEGLTRTLARELGPDRIRVNCLIPGWVFTERQLAQLVTPETLAKLDQVQSLKDNIMPADVARMVLWLAADDSAMCTGQKWIVDGGWM